MIFITVILPLRICPKEINRGVRIVLCIKMIGTNYLQQQKVWNSLSVYIKVMLTKIIVYSYEEIV